MTLLNVNLALSNRCNAKCIWCPTSRGTKHNFDMSKDIAFKVIDELAEFDYDINGMHFSENGEAIYNKDFMEILLYASEKLPNTKLNMLSNFGLMSRSLSEQICKSRTINAFQVNIDGHDSASYRAVKGISYESVMRNLKTFLEMRQQYHPEMEFAINVMPAFEYSVTVNTLMQALPDQVQDKEVPYSSFEHTRDSLQSLVKKYGVQIRHSKSGLWAERKTFQKNIDKMNIDQSKMDCPMFDRVKSEAFIAPNGDWYPCCLDDNNDIVLGNVTTQTVQEIYTSQRRLEFVEKVKNRQWEEIGYPCNTVACCHGMQLPKSEYVKIEKNFKPGTSIKLKG